MKKFIRNKKLVISLAIFIFTIALIAVSVNIRNRRSAPPVIQRFGNDVVAIFAKVVNWPVSIVSGGLDSVGNLINTYQENDHLKSQVDDLAQTKVENSTLKEENKQLKANLALKRSLTDYEMISGTVISRSPTSWADIVVIDQGSNSGLKKDMAVMAGNGVVGRIIEVDHTTSKVELITTSDKSASRFSVQTKSNSGKTVYGLITSYNENSNSLILSQVNNGTKLKRGARLYTSGLGGRSPKGLLVGTVKQTTKDQFGLSDQIEIKPAADLNNFTVVSIILRKAAESDD